MTLEGHASNDDTLICWGMVRMTMTGDRFGAVPNGRRAELPVFIQFNFKDDLITREAFLFRPLGALRAVGDFHRRGASQIVWREQAGMMSRRGMVAASAAALAAGVGARKGWAAPEHTHK